MLFGIFGKKKKARMIEITLIEGGTRTKIFETAIEAKATEFLEMNMCADSGELTVVEASLRTLGKAVFTVIRTRKVLEVKIRND